MGQCSAPYCSDALNSSPGTHGLLESQVACGRRQTPRAFLAHNRHVNMEWFFIKMYTVHPAPTIPLLLLLLLLCMSCVLQLKAQGRLAPPPPPPPVEEANKDEEPSFKPFAGKGYSLKG